MQAYKPSDRVPLLGVLLLLAAAIPGGVLVGLIVYFISRLIYLVLIFPLLIGLLGGVLIAGATYLGKVRSPAIAMFFGLLIALTVYGSFRYFEYAIGFRKDLRDEIEDAYGEAISDDDYKLDERIYLQDETGSSGFAGYVKLDAKFGFQITRTTTGTTSSGLTIKGAFAYGYWIVEFALLAAASIAVSIQQARAPFSEEANEWFGKSSYLATVQPNAHDAVINALQQGDFARAGGCLYVESALSVPRVQISARRTQSPEASVALSVRRYYRDSRGNIRDKAFLEGIVAAADLNTLTGAIRRRI